MIPLAFANEGSLVQIVEVRAGQGLTRRLAELGLTQGSTLRVVKSLSPGPVVVEVVNDNGYTDAWGFRDNHEDFRGKSGMSVWRGELYS
ncbi:MAG: Ferrous iron transport protein A [Candidatus Hecatellales archaeon B24]|nr:MAG: Ferrous iron transport protein A [Candidatus Hecatellales archaeon B24]